MIMRKSVGCFTTRRGVNYPVILTPGYKPLFKSRVTNKTILCRAAGVDIASLEMVMFLKTDGVAGGVPAAVGTRATHILRETVSERAGL